MTTTDCGGSWHDWLHVTVYEPDDVRVFRCDGCGDLWVHHHASRNQWVLPPLHTPYTATVDFIAAFVRKNTPIPATPTPSILPELL